MRLCSQIEYFGNSISNANLVTYIGSGMKTNPNKKETQTKNNSQLNFYGNLTTSIELKWSVLMRQLSLCRSWFQFVFLSIILNFVRVFAWAMHGWGWAALWQQWSKSGGQWFETNNFIVYGRWVSSTMNMIINNKHVQLLMV